MSGQILGLLDPVQSGIVPALECAVDLENKIEAPLLKAAGLREWVYFDGISKVSFGVLAVTATMTIAPVTLSRGKASCAASISSITTIRITTSTLPTSIRGARGWWSGRGK